MSQEEANQIVREAERRRRSLRPPMKVLLPVAAALGAGGAVAAASIPGSDHVVHGCYATNTDGVTMQAPVRIGALRVIDPSLPATTVTKPGTPAIANYAAVCMPDEATIDWNQQGLPGPSGAAGAPGTPGAQGAAGAPLIGETTFGFSTAGGQTFLKIEGLKGEVTQKGYVGDIAISSYSIGAGNGNIGSSNTGGGAGKTSVHDLTITKTVDKSSPTLFAAAATGKHFSNATIILVRKAGEKPLEYLKIKMTDAIVSSYKTGSSSNGRPTESVSFNFTKIEATFPASGNNGQKIKSVTSAINLSQNVR
jgi:type VI secretion system secreted protein Hcp